MIDILAPQVSLRQINLHMTSGGSLTCKHRSIKNVEENTPKRIVFLPFSLGLQAVQEALPVGLNSVRLCGEDTLCHPEIGRTLDYLESLELSMQVETSGAGLTAPLVSRLARIPQNSITALLWGANPTTHDAYAATPGSFENATRAVRTLSDGGLPVQVIFPVLRHNVQEIPDLVRLVEELGGESIRFTLLRTESLQLPQKGIGNDHKDISANMENLSIATDSLQVEELIALGWRIERGLAYTTSVHLIFDQPPAFRGLHPKARTKRQVGCNTLNCLSITSAGEYTLCNLHYGRPNLTLGRVSVDRLDQIWSEHATLQLLRSGLPDRLQGVCKHCTLKQSCLGSCPVENYQRTGSFWGPGWFCEAADRVGLFPAGRLIENYW